MPKQTTSRVASPFISRRELVQTAVSGTVAVAALSAAWPVWAQASGTALPKAGSVLRLPDMTLLDGSVWRASEMRGKTLVVYWWASWCPFCAVQSPHIEALWRAHKAAGLCVLALSIDKQPAAASAYLAAKGYSFPAGMLTAEVAQSLPKPAGLPVVVVLKSNAQDGRIGQFVFAESGEMFPEDVEGLKKYL